MRGCGEDEITRVILSVNEEKKRKKRDGIGLSRDGKEKRRGRVPVPRLETRGKD